MMTLEKENQGSKASTGNLIEEQLLYMKMEQLQTKIIFLEMGFHKRNKEFTK